MVKDVISFFTTTPSFVVFTVTGVFVLVAAVVGMHIFSFRRCLNNWIFFTVKICHNSPQMSTFATQVEIFWDAPKGEFTKYTLYIDKLDPLAERQISSGGGGGGGMSRNPTFLRMPSLISSQTQGSGGGGDGGGGGAQSARLVWQADLETEGEFIKRASLGILYIST